MCPAWPRTPRPALLCAPSHSPPARPPESCGPSAAHTTARSAVAGSGRARHHRLHRLLRRRGSPGRDAYVLNKISGRPRGAAGPRRMGPTRRLRSRGGCAGGGRPIHRIAPCAMQPPAQRRQGTHTAPEMTVGALSHSAGTAPIVMVLIPGTPLQTTPLPKRA